MEDIEVPSWMTERMLETVISSNPNFGLVNVNKFKVTRCVPKGNNFLSNVLRITIKFQRLFTTNTSAEEISLIAKIPLKDEALVTLCKTGIVEREVQAFYDFIPKLNKLFLSVKENPITPFSYNCDVEEVLIMEDLDKSGYKMIDKRDQLDYEHGLATLKQIARFHAASVKLHENEPNLVENIGRHLLYKKNMDNDVISLLDPVQGVKHLEMLGVEFDKWPETKKYVPFLTKLAPKFWDLMLPAIDCYDKEFVTLNHGDLHTGNMFFMYDDKNNIVDVKFIDLQMMRYTCPVMDVTYFIHTSIKYDVIDKHYDELTQYYLENLNIYLEKYKSEKRWNFADFKKSLQRREIFALIICINVLPFMFAGSNDFSNEQSSEYPYFDYSKNEKFRNTCAKFLENYSNRSWYKNLLI